MCGLRVCYFTEEQFLFLCVGLRFCTRNSCGACNWTCNLNIGKKRNLVNGDSREDSNFATWC